jgi:transglutaminase-like putative cysteine protease
MAVLSNGVCYIIKLMSRTAKIINGIVFCIWITLLSLLVYQNYAGTPLEKSLASQEALGKEVYWYDIYAGKKKIGFASTGFGRVGDEIAIKHEREIKVERGGQTKILMEMLKCITDSSYSIKSFEYSSHYKDEEGIKVTGKVDEENIIFFLESPEKRKVFKTPTKGRDFYLPITFIPALVQKKPSPNSAFVISLLNIVSLSIDDVKVVLEEIRPIKVGIDIFSLYKFRTGNSMLWSNEKGVIIKEESSGITFYSEVEKFAKDPADRFLFDYTALPFLKSNTLIADTEKLQYLKVKIKGFTLDPQLYRDSTVTITKDILIIQKEAIESLKKKTYTLPYGEERFAEYTKPDVWVMSNYKPLEDTGRIYARSNNNDAFQLTQYLTTYLYILIRTKPLFVLSDSVNILESLSGDYLERAVMFASYARAAGLPTRLVSGVVYLYGYFYFHIWPEVWLNEWVPVDPAFYQFPADVTHIPLKEGTLKDITSIVDDLKNIEIEILEVS